MKVPSTLPSTQPGLDDPGGAAASAPSSPDALDVARRLASGVANDFNNLLQVIGGHAERLLGSPSSQEARSDAARSIMAATQRAAQLTDQLHAFGHRAPHVAPLESLGGLIKAALPSLRSHVAPRIVIAAHVNAWLPRVRVDAARFRQVLTYLIDNASDDMPTGGTVTLVTSSLRVGPQVQRLRPWVKEGRYVRVEIGDSGRGLDARTLAHVFEPFAASTPRLGAGLRLAAVYGIIKDCGGFVWVESEVGQGSRVTVLFPVPTAGGPPEQMAREHRRVVLVEDDEGVRGLLDDVLMHHGFEVSAYGSAEDALTHASPFDLLVTDAGLPGLDGPSLVREIQRTMPTMPVLLMSGDSRRAQQLGIRLPCAFIQKPFTSRALMETVEQLLSP